MSKIYLQGEVLTAVDLNQSFLDLKTLPINPQTSTYTLVVDDIGKVISATGSINIPANVFADGGTVSIFNNSGAVINIIQAAGLTLYNASTGVAGSFTLNSRGICSVIFINTTTAVLAGVGVSVTASGSLQGPVGPSSSSLRNRIINGDMRIDQRNSGTEVNPAVSGVYYLDRWQAAASVASKFKIGQNAGAVTPPTGYTNYLGSTSLSAYTVGAGETFVNQQKIEGYNISDLAWGTASAATVTLSFWVRSSLTGTFGGSLRNSGLDRSYPFSYTISVANTWEQKTITIAGDTSGTWLTNNGIGISVIFSLGTGTTYSGPAGAWASTNYVSATGATSVVGTNGATWYVTGVQFEVGTVATSFERQIFSNQLAQCQRYYYFLGGETPYQNINTVIWYTATECVGQFSYPVTMRGVPTVSKTGNWTGLGNGTAGNSINADQINTKNLQLGALGGSGGTFGYGTILRGNNDTSLRVTFSAEL